MLGKPGGPRRQAWVDLEDSENCQLGGGASWAHPGSGEAEPPRPIPGVAQLHPAYKEVIFCRKASSNHSEEGMQEESQGRGPSGWTHSNLCRVGAEPHFAQAADLNGRCLTGQMGSLKWASPRILLRPPTAESEVGNRRVLGTTWPNTLLW